jgi:Zn-dependent protease with chaperone function
MELEPEVLEAVQKKKRRLLAQEAAVLVVLAVLVAAVLALIIIPFALGNTSFSPFVRKSGMSGLVWGGIVVALLVGIAGIALYLVARSRDLEYFARFTARARDYGVERLARFMNALEGAASKAGVEPPRVSVLDNELPDAAAFSEKGEPVIGVTSGLLGAGLAYEEAEAVMAHELASVIAADYLRRPGAMKFEGASLALLWVLAMVSVVAIPISRRGHTPLVSLGVALVILACLILISLWLRHLNKLREHDYILADSIAVTITGKPEAMESAIRRIDGLVNGGRGNPYPASELGLKYLFLPPYKWRENATMFLRRRSIELDYDMKDSAVQRRAANLQESMDELSEWGQHLLAERLENLEDIVEGSWPAFE